MPGDQVFHGAAGVAPHASEPTEPAAIISDEKGDCGDGNRAQRVIRRCFKSNDLATRAALAEVTGHLAAHGLSEDDLGNVELALAEALNNVTEHAYGPEGGLIELAVEVAPERVCCKLRDHGQPLPSGPTLRGEPPVIAPPDNLPEGGFGWHIIRCLVSEIGYRRDANGNSLSFALTRNQDSEGCTSD